jgi:septal ring factor EnvC (AmiA/AmiB activator)
MSLSYDDLQAIRKIVEETVSPIQGNLEALSNDIKEIYEMISELQKESKNTDSQNSSIEEKLLRLHAELVEAAKQAGVTLPAH